MLSFSVLLTGCTITPVLCRPDLPLMRFLAPFINHLLFPFSLSFYISLFLSASPPPPPSLSSCSFSSSLPCRLLLLVVLFLSFPPSLYLYLTADWINYLLLSFPLYYPCFIAFEFHNLFLFWLFLFFFLTHMCLTFTLLSPNCVCVYCVLADEFKE